MAEFLKKQALLAEQVIANLNSDTMNIYANCHGGQESVETNEEAAQVRDA